MFNKALIAIVLLLLTSCAIKTGQDFDTSYISKIERGKTTKDQIRSNLGQPTSVSTTSAGESWRYSYTEGGNYLQTVTAAFGARPLKNEQKLLIITFSGNVVKDYKYTEGEFDPASTFGTK